MISTSPFYSAITGQASTFQHFSPSVIVLSLQVRTSWAVKTWLRSHIISRNSNNVKASMSMAPDEDFEIVDTGSFCQTHPRIIKLADNR